MEQKIEELNQKYSKLINDKDNYNTRFTKNFQNFYQYAIAAGEEDFSKGVQATKKLKKLIDTLFESSKLANQIIVNEAFYSIQILIATLLQSTRWQDNNAGIWIIIVQILIMFHSFTQNQIIIFQIQFSIFDIQYIFIKLIILKQQTNCIKNLSQIFKLHLTQYLEESEEMFQENTSKLLTLLMNKNDIFLKPEYLVIQEKLVQSMNSSLQLCDKFQDYFQAIINYLNQDNNQLIGLFVQKVDCSEKYISKIQLSPLLQILKELQSKTNINNFTDLLLKCCLINQKQTQLSAFNQLLNIEDADQNDFIEVLRYSLLHNNIEIIKLGTLIAKQVIKNYDCNLLQEIKLIIYLNQSLIPVGEISTDLILNKFKIQRNDKAILKDNFKLILNICSILAKNEDQEFREQSWKVMYNAIKLQSNQDCSQLKKQLIQLCQTAQNETRERPIYYFLYFVEQVIQKIQEQDKNENENLLFVNIICNFVGQFKNNGITTKIFDIFSYFDFNEAQLLQLQSQKNVQDSIEIQQAWKELKQKLLQPKPKV